MYGVQSILDKLRWGKNGFPETFAFFIKDIPYRSKPIVGWLAIPYSIIILYRIGIIINNNNNSKNLLLTISYTKLKFYIYSFKFF